MPSIETSSTAISREICELTRSRICRCWRPVKAVVPNEGENGQNQQGCEQSLKPWKAQDVEDSHDGPLGTKFLTLTGLKKNNHSLIANVGDSWSDNFRLIIYILTRLKQGFSWKLFSKILLQRRKRKPKQQLLTVAAQSAKNKKCAGHRYQRKNENHYS